MLRCAALLHGIKIGGDDYEHASVLNPKVEGTAVDPGLGDGQACHLVGVTRQVVDRLLTSRDLIETEREGL